MLTVDPKSKIWARCYKQLQKNISTVIESGSVRHPRYLHVHNCYGIPIAIAIYNSESLMITLNFLI